MTKPWWMGMLVWGAIQTVAGGDPSRLKRFAVRFSRPVLPGQEISGPPRLGQHHRPVAKDNCAGPVA